MKLEVNKLVSRDVKTVTTVREKRYIVVTFDDPLFPGETIRFDKRFQIKDGKLPYFDVYYFLEERYMKKIGFGWKMMNTTDDGFDAKSGRYAPIPISEQNARLKLVRERNNAVIRTVKMVREIIQLQAQ